MCAQEAYLQLELDRVMLMPARIPPHKPVDEEPGPEHRLELCRLAVRDDERFEVSDLEVKREGTSYTVDTLMELRSQAPDTELVLIVGADVAAGLPHWRQPEQVLSMARLAVAKRRGTPPAAVEAALQALRGAERAAFFRMPRIAVSSTMIRRRVQAREPIRYIVPDAVIEYIERHHLYRGIN